MNNNIKTIYIHAGMPKTGTTSIQGFLSLNRNTLKKNGLLYPVCGKGNSPYNSSHPNLRPLISSSNVFIAKNEEIKNFFKKNSDKFYLNEINSSKQDRIILSDEAFTVMPNCINGLKIFVELLRELGFNVKIIIYLRQPADFISSLWQECIKGAGMKVDILDILGEEVSKTIFSIPNLIQELGRDCFIIKSFEKASWKNGDLLDDFLDIFNINLDNTFKQLKEVRNIGFGRNHCQILRMINLLELSDVRFMEKARDITVPKEVKIVETLSDEEILTITDRYKDVYSEIANIYGRDSFFECLFPSCYGKERLAYRNLSFSVEQIDLLFEALLEKSREREGS